MDEQVIARKVLIEQTRRELLSDIKQYLVGVLIKGEMIVKKNTDITNGRIFFIPDDKYESLFGGE